MKSVGVTPKTNLLVAFRQTDKVRIEKAAKKITEKARLIRRKARAKGKTVDEEKVLYKRGFGLGKTPESLIFDADKRKTKLLKRKRKGSYTQANIQTQGPISTTNKNNHECDFVIA